MTPEERVSKIIDDYDKDFHLHVGLSGMIDEIAYAIHSSIREEREACIRIAERHECCAETALSIAKEIRKRGAE